MLLPSGSLENSPDDRASVPALHSDALPIGAASKPLRAGVETEGKIGSGSIAGARLEAVHNISDARSREPFDDETRVNPCNA